METVLMLLTAQIPLWIVVIWIASSISDPLDQATKEMETKARSMELEFLAKRFLPGYHVDAGTNYWHVLRQIYDRCDRGEMAYADWKAWNGPAEEIAERVAQRVEQSKKSRT